MRITTIGEILIDMTQTGTDANGNAIFAAIPGGAPANLAVAARKLGVETAFIGCVGNDPFGAILKNTLLHYGVDERALEICGYEELSLGDFVLTGGEYAAICGKVNAETARRMNADVFCGSR